MSVQIALLKGGKEFDDVGVCAPDYDADYVWLWLDDDPDTRIDLSRDQLDQLVDAHDRMARK